MNKKIKLFVVSDVHGYYTVLKQALDNAGFDDKNEEHLLICCGDYFDRGTENMKVLKYFELLKNKVLLRGNHEDMLLEIFESGKLKPHNYLNGTAETIIELFGKYALDPASSEIDFSGKTRTLDRITQFIEGTGDYFETKNYIFTHGWLPTKVENDSCIIDPDWRNASKERWKKSRWTKWIDMYLSCNRPGDKTLVCGHVPAFFANKFEKERKADDFGAFYGNGVIVADAGTYTSLKVNVIVIEDELL